MSGKEDEDLSLIISSTLDHFGYSREMISFRSKSYDNIGNLIQKKKFGNEPVTVMCVGSAGEGVELSDSDLDLMLLTDTIVCTDQAMDNKHLNILKTDYTNSCPGYTKVVSTHLVMDTITGSACYNSSTNVSPEGHPYISSGVFKNMIYQNTDKFLPLLTPFCTITSNGPAATSQMFNSKKIDWVFSVSYFGNTILSKWANRKRFNNWPSNAMIKQISEMEGYIVPVGNKESENQGLEWRICYTTAEMAMIRNLTDAQLKLYILLKMVVGSIIKPECKEITSYVVKNVLFWVIEVTPAYQFTPKLLVKLVKKCLYFFKYCLENNHIPNYMIPERNLMRFSFHGKDKLPVIHFISGLLEDGGSLLQRIPKLYTCMFLECTSPKRVQQYAKWREEVEKLSSPLQTGIKMIDLTNVHDNHYIYCSENGSSVTIESSSFMILQENIGQQSLPMATIRECINMILPDAHHLLMSGHLVQYFELLKERLKLLKPL
ncbi:uncharacterized protein LOC123556514 [Mercenaria mercenaria]|uniref:uncharacterized protein LOC123556514 n=1 Tax=Mercenaria mercenaria TaxID=6596 RepID=UPI00234E7DAD|nr:uncharacterized protein LOC123556514 [Mercenaria mercenaria]